MEQQFEINGNLVPDWLKKRVQTGSNSTAVVYSAEVSDVKEEISWGELDNKATETAGRLASQGIVEGSRVALLMGNSLRFVELFHALIKIKAVLVPLNTRLTVPELGWQLKDVNASCLIFDKQNVSKANSIKLGYPEIAYYAECELIKLTPVNIPSEGWIDLEKLHTIIYSSGTTGRPKGVRLTYGNHFWSAVASSLNLGNVNTDRWLAVLPLFHVGGLSILFKSLIYGIPAVVQPVFNAETVNRSIEEQGVTIISVVAVMLQRMLDQLGNKSYGSHLRCVLLGGGPAPLPLLERCREAGVPVVQTYGMTETASQFATLAPEDAFRKLGSAGLPLLPNALRIVDNGQDVKQNEIGEIVVKGPTLAHSYDHLPDETAKAFRDGWFYTGDLGRLDTDGYLYVIDRRDDLIISGGENVYPAEIEETLLGCPAVDEVGIFGVPNQKWGAVPVAAVKIKPGFSVSEAEILNWASFRLANYKLPASIIFVDEMPRNAGGKLLRRVLRENYSKTYQGKVL